MNKNLKKVISAAAVLAMSASSVAAFAASYPDVADTASYKQAVDELSAMNIINGYEDGTFQPDKNVTRAEITKMVVTALGSSALKNAEASTGKATQFADVPGTHWAAGYVATGTSDIAGNFINGYSATEFGPEDNVTFAQAMKMLVGALGYTYYSEQNGGWPNGYLSYGYQLGISDGVTNVANDQQVTRAQVAQMIDNALKAPICIVNGYETNVLGTSTPKLLVKDGTGDSTGKDGYQNLLNYAHDAYVVYGRVQGTHKSDSGIDKDQVKFSVEKTDNWEGYSVAKGVNLLGEEIGDITMYTGTSKADELLLTYAEAIIQKDEDDEYTILSITPYGKNETVSFKADDLAEDKTALAASGKGTLYAYMSDTSSKTTSYKLDLDKIYAGEEGGFYVNGKQLNASDETELQTLIDTYVKAATSVNLAGEVTLIDSPAAGTSTTDGNYDYVMVTFYATGVVDSVAGTEMNPTVYFSDGSSGIGTLSVDYDDEDMDYEFLLDGQSIKASELQAGDVLSITYDVEEGFSNSESYSALVSRGNVVEGQCRTVNSDKDKFTMDNGTKYQAAYEGVAVLEAGTSYTLYLDVFGNIAKVDDLASAKKIAILDNAYQQNSGDYAATIITADGTKVTYALKNEQTGQDYAKIVYPNGGDKNADKAFVADRVVEYSVNSSNQLTVRKVLAPATVEVAKDYKETTQRIGTIKVADGVTNMLDLSDYYDGDTYKDGKLESMGVYDGTYAKTAVTALTDGDTYTAYAFEKTSSDKLAQFVLLMEGTSGLNVTSNMAVYASEAIGRTPNDMDATIITAYVGGEMTELYLDNDNGTTMSEGDLFFFTKNSDGEVDKIVKVFANDNTLNQGYDAMYTAAIAADFDDMLSAEAKSFGKDGGEFKKNSSINADDCAIVFGPIVDRSGSNIAIATGADTTGTIFTPDNVDTTSVAADVKVYKYDYAKKADYRLSVGSLADAARTVFAKDAYTSNDKIDVDLDSADLTANMTSTYGKVNFAVAKVVDDEITEMVVIVPNPSSK